MRPKLRFTTSYDPVQYEQDDLQIIYKRAGVKCVGILFVLTDRQIFDEVFRVHLTTCSPPARS